MNQRKRRAGAPIERASGSVAPAAVAGPGVYAAVLTPMNGSGVPLPETLIGHCRRLFDEGCHGVAPLGTTGEANSLMLKDKLTVIEAVADTLPAERVIIGTGSCSLGDAVFLTRRALTGGLVNVLVLPPFYYKNITDDGLLAFYSEMIERAGDDRLRLFLYNFPQQTGIRLSLDLIAGLASRYPAIIAGVKDSSGDPAFLEALCAGHAGLRIFVGMESLLARGMALGGAGCISALANVAAPLCRSVFDQPGLQGRSAVDQRMLADLKTLTARYPTVPTLKMLIARRTGDPNWLTMLPPNLPLRADEAAAAHHAYQAIIDGGR